MIRFLTAALVDCPAAVMNTDDRLLVLNMPEGIIAVSVDVGSRSSLQLVLMFQMLLPTPALLSNVRSAPLTAALLYRDKPHAANRICLRPMRKNGMRERHDAPPAKEFSKNGGPHGPESQDCPHDSFFFPSLSIAQQAPQTLPRHIVTCSLDFPINGFSTMRGTCQKTAGPGDTSGTTMGLQNPVDLPTVWMADGSFSAFPAVGEYRQAYVNGFSTVGTPVGIRSPRTIRFLRDTRHVPTLCRFPILVRVVRFAEAMTQFSAE